MLSTAAGLAPTGSGRRWSEPVIPAWFLHRLVSFPLSLQQQDTCVAVHHQPCVISTKVPAGSWILMHPSARKANTHQLSKRFYMVFFCLALNSRCVPLVLYLVDVPCLYIFLFLLLLVDPMESFLNHKSTTQCSCFVPHGKIFIQSSIILYLKRKELCTYHSTIASPQGFYLE